MTKELKNPELLLATKVERLAELAALVTSAAPWIGGPVAEIIGGVATNLKIKRVTQFIKEVLARAEALHTQAAEEFVRSEDFVDILDKTSAAVADERNEEKRTLFSNYILNNMARPEISYDFRLKCLRLLSELDTRHLDLLRALLQPPTNQELSKSISAPITTIQSRAPRIRDALAAIIHETNTLGLTSIKDQYLNTNMTGDGAAKLHHAVTQLGNDFLAFITAPD